MNNRTKKKISNTLNKAYADLKVFIFCKKKIVLYIERF